MEQEFSLYHSAWEKALAGRSFVPLTSEPEPEKK